MEKNIIQESFIKDSILTIIEKTCFVLQRRIGAKIHVGQIPIDVVTSGGQKLSGIICTIDDGRQIRWNWKTTDTSCTIISLTYWTKIKVNPDIEIDLNDYNIVKIIDAVAEVLNTNKIGNIALAESIYKIEEGQISDNIKEAIKAWSTDMEMSDEKLAKMRIKELWRSFRYWFEEVGGQQKGFNDMSEGSFRNYLLAYFQKYNIVNPFVKVINSKEAGREKIVIADKSEEKKFNDDLYKMSMDEQRGYIVSSLLMLVQCYQNALIVGGQAGAGKTFTIESSLSKISGMKFVYARGSMKNTEELFKFFQNNNSENTLIIFDDFDFVFDKKNLDIMKAIMAPDKKREITWYSSNINQDKLYKDTGVDTFLAKQQGIEIKKSNKKSYVPTFEFKSKVLIITNRVKHRIDPALLSRGTYVEISFSKEEILTDIRKNVDILFPEFKDILTDKIKIEVIDFIEPYLKSVFQLDYRIFRTVCCFRVVNPYNPLWKKYAMNALRAEL